jgi:nucleoside-diphosphate-sugar epimerase
LNPLAGRRSLVTGAAGFVGANLVRELLRLEAEVCAMVRPGTDLWRISEILPSLKLVPLDLDDREPVLAAVREARPDFIFHLAARGVSAHGADRAAILRTNVLGTYHLLEAAATAELRALVYTGGSSEYGAADKPMSENDPPLPVTFYGATKAASTLLSLQFAREHGLPLVALRPFSIYGPWESPGRLIPTAIRAVLDGGTIDLTVPGCRRDLVFVGDVVEACVLAAGSPAAQGETLNVGTGIEWTNEAVVDLIQTLAGRTVEVRSGVFPTRAGDRPHWAADWTRAKEILGWEPRHSLQLGLEKTIAWTRGRVQGA